MQHDLPAPLGVGERQLGDAAATRRAKGSGVPELRLPTII